MKNVLNQDAAIFWKQNLCQFIDWETLTSKGEIIITINNKNFIANINYISNEIIEYLKL